MSAIGRVLNPPLGRALECSRGRLIEVVALAGLVIKSGDPAERVGTEGILRCRVSVATPVRRGGLNDADFQGLAVRLAHDLVERAVVRGRQRARRAVGGHARGAGSGVDVTRTFLPGRNIASNPGNQQRGYRQRECQGEHYYKTFFSFHDFVFCKPNMISWPVARDRRRQPRNNMTRHLRKIDVLGEDAIVFQPVFAAKRETWVVMERFCPGVAGKSIRTPSS